MLRLFLGLFLVMTVGLVLALQTVEHTFNALLDNQMQAYNREACAARRGHWSSTCAISKARPVNSSWKRCARTTACR
jgi:hypothetical protein